MKKLRLILILIGLVLIGIALFDVDYTDFFSRANRGTLASALGMVFMIIAILISNWEEKKGSRK